MRTGQATRNQGNIIDEIKEVQRELEALSITQEQLIERSRVLTRELRSAASNDNVSAGRGNRRNAARTQAAGQNTRTAQTSVFTDVNGIELKI